MMGLLQGSQTVTVRYQYGVTIIKLQKFSHSRWHTGAVPNLQSADPPKNPPQTSP